MLAHEGGLHHLPLCSALHSSKPNVMATVPTQQARLTWPSSSPTPGPPAFLLYAINIFLGSRSAKLFVFCHFIVGVCVIIRFKFFAWLGRDR